MSDKIVPHVGGFDVQRVMELAIDKGAGVEALERLVALQERILDRNAASEFAEAMAAFQAECPPIRKNKEAPKTVTKSGAQYGGYAYATLDEIARTVNPILTKHGLSYTWNTVFDGGKMLVECVLRHVNGHSISSKFEAPTETPATMSPQQKVASGQSYGRRYSLISVLGLTTCDPDDEEAGMDQGPVTPDQVVELEALVDQARAHRGRFLAWLGVETMEEVRSGDFERAVAALREKIRVLR